jgi:23S rRNA (cytidine2498-2'-O)-methyltransferase
VTHGFVVTPGFEPALLAEIAPAVGEARVAAPGVVVGEREPAAAPLDPVFARQQLPDARPVGAPSVSALAEAAYAALQGAVDGGRGPFTLHAYSVPAASGGDDDEVEAAIKADAQLGSRIALVGRETLALMQKRRKRAFARYRAPDDLAAAMNADATLLQLCALDRTSLLASAASPQPLPHGGWSLAPWPGGAAPIAIDRAPPSRAYQKLEEAFLWMSAAPGPGDLCVDLGAAPGGWTMTALRRGARVIAVDRAPLESPAAPHPRLAMTIGNAFTYTPPSAVNWLLCDVICEPQRSIDLALKWLQNRWCRALVCTIKFKGRDGYGVLSPLPAQLAAAGARFQRVKQLRHNKNEVTLMAMV